MNKIKRYIIFLRNGSAKKLVLTVVSTVWKTCSLKYCRVLDKYFDSRKRYKESNKGLNPISLSCANLDYSGIERKKAETLWQMYSEHRFDLLGSGWINSNFIQDSPGIEGYKYPNLVLNTDDNGDFLAQIMRPKNVVSSKRIFSKIDREYEPIDWQKDFKSGYRWGANLWYRPQEVAKLPGGDIKVPWELSRLQHLPRLAILSQVLPEKKTDIFREFRNQLLDFIAQNPVRMGVNHMCTMDVGIRVANIALACSLWIGNGQKLDTDFGKIVTNYLFEECQFIRTNLEWSYYLTSNHYFADIAGLLWGSSVLPKCRKRDHWICFARRQLLNEIRKQFHVEGSNAEGSTAYHRLTGEMAVYSVALIHYLSQIGTVEDAGQEIYDLLYKAGRFSNDIMRPDGMFPQIGDNDSGLFFRLSITGEIDVQGRLVEAPNDARTYVSATSGMFNSMELIGAKTRYPLEHSLIRKLCGYDWTQFSEERIYVTAEKRESNLDFQKDYFIDSEGISLLKDLYRMDYPEFGLYIFKSLGLYLCFNLSDNGQKGNSGHAHNDKLSFELFFGERCIYEDPGTYVYTPFPELRDKFRSTKYHNTIYCGEEQNHYNGLFSMCNDTKCFVTELKDNLIEAQVEYRGIIHRRRIEILNNGIIITDKCNREFEQQFIQQPVARGYGRMER